MFWTENSGVVTKVVSAVEAFVVENPDVVADSGVPDVISVVSSKDLVVILWAVVSTASVINSVDSSLVSWVVVCTASVVPPLVNSVVTCVVSLSCSFFSNVKKGAMDMLQAIGSLSELLC